MIVSLATVVLLAAEGGEGFPFRGADYAVMDGCSNSFLLLVVVSFYTFPLIFGTLVVLMMASIAETGLQQSF